jgi:hypothetical protein
VRDRARAYRDAAAGERRPAAARAAPDLLTALRQAGNQATGRALARAPERQQKTSHDYAMDVAGIGEIAITSWRLTAPHEIEVMFPEGPAAPVLAQAATSGEAFASVVIRRDGHSVTLTEAQVTRFSMSEDPGGSPLVTVGFQGATLAPH